MKNLTIIIPVGTLQGESDIELLKRAVGSAGNNKTIVVGPTETINSLKGQNIGDVILLENKGGDTSYPGNVMYALGEVKTDYFSPLEYDDEYTGIWFDNVEKYMVHEGIGTFAYLPLTEVVDYETKKHIGYANEAVWASSFSDEIGCYDIQAMTYYMGFNVSGGVFRKDAFIAMGGLKTSMKMMYWYEFMLRALYKEKRIFVIPKVGCLHTVNRPGGLTDTQSRTIDEKEADWWIELSKQEYFFPQDRNKQYATEE